MRKENMKKYLMLLLLTVCTVSLQAQDNRTKAFHANVRAAIILLALLLTLLATARWAAQNRKKRSRQVAKYNLSVIEREKLKEELNSLKSKNYDTVIAQKETEIAELSQAIAKYENAYQRVMAKNSLTDLENSAIAHAFAGKKTFRKDQAMPTNEEWSELISKFESAMPAVYAAMNHSGQNLSALQLKVCILLLLGYEESIIATLTNTKPQTVNTAKMRANSKMFMQNDSASLRANLLRLVANSA